MTVLAVLGWTAFVAGLLSWVYTAAAIVFVGHFVRASLQRSQTAPEQPGGVVILKPLHGVEPGLRHNLEQFFLQASGTRARVVLGVQDPLDPALAVVQTLCDAYPTVDARLVVGRSGLAGNRKISNLISMMADIDEPILILSDSDIGVEGPYLEKVTQALTRPGIGVVTCPYYGKTEGGVWSQLAAMGLTYQFLPNVLTGVGLRLAHPCMGSTIALRRTTLEQIGGFQAFNNVLADDFAIGAAVRRLGVGSALAPILVSHSCTEATWSALFSHELRWARTVRGVDSTGHLGSLLTHPVPLCLLAAMILWDRPVAWALLALSLGARLWLKLALDRGVGRSTGSWWLLPMRDMISLLVFAASFMGRSVEWRGAKFHVTKDGGLRPV